MKELGIFVDYFGDWRPRGGLWPGFGGCQPPRVNGGTDTKILRDNNRPWTRAGIEELREQCNIRLRAVRRIRSAYGPWRGFQEPPNLIRMLKRLSQAEACATNCR